jgi:hypothetical protein
VAQNSGALNTCSHPPRDEVCPASYEQEKVRDVLPLGFCVWALCSYTGKTDGELSFEGGDVIAIEEMNGKSW